jgi:bifunctional UDP-N-acetylglucosamine pyrophosphorylase / glucosamine-1-phosphate N-acetyltransferase
MKKNITCLSYKVKQLMERGVRIANPLSVEIGDEVEIDRISGDGVIIYPGSRIYGNKTLVSEGSKLGYEAPVTVVDCQIGPQVELKGGFFKSSVFLSNSNISSGALVREGCILEEEANAAHTVGLKQTILFPYVTLGSLINFCDCLMAGGTSRKDHSEVGSSYIHFNYTPNQDKATPSLIGDVPRGVMLNQPPIFLGGQGGLVGPARIGYGTVIAAGTVYRKDCPEGGKLLTGDNNSAGEKRFHKGFYGDITKQVYNNILYIANLMALREWYMHVRQPFFQSQKMGSELHAGAMDKLETMIGERLKRFKTLSDNMEKSIAHGHSLTKGDRKKTILKQKKEFLENWPKLEMSFTNGQESRIDQRNRDAFIEIVHRKVKESGSYIQFIKDLDNQSSTTGTAWLQNIVDDMAKSALSHLPSFRG